MSVTIQRGERRLARSGCSGKVKRSSEETATEGSGRLGMIPRKSNGLRKTCLGFSVGPNTADPANLRRTLGGGSLVEENFAAVSSGERGGADECQG